MSKKKNKKPLPSFKSDEDAARFVNEADLTQFDLSGGHEVHFEFEKKTARVNMRLPQKQLEALKAEAKKRGIPYQRFMRELLDLGLRSLQHR